MEKFKIERLLSWMRYPISLLYYVIHLYFQLKRTYKYTNNNWTGFLGGLFQDCGLFI